MLYTNTFSISTPFKKIQVLLRQNLFFSISTCSNVKICLSIFIRSRLDHITRSSFRVYAILFDSRQHVFTNITNWAATSNFVVILPWNFLMSEKAGIFSQNIACCSFIVILLSFYLLFTFYFHFLCLNKFQSNN